jgi:hypothetical protein
VNAVRAQSRRGPVCPHEPRAARRSARGLGAPPAVGVCGQQMNTGRIRTDAHGRVELLAKYLGGRRVED